MNSKERMLRAIHREKPDRLPVTVHQWQTYHLKYYMDGMTDIEANLACGFDASINYYEIDETNTPNWRVSASISQMHDYMLTDYTVETPDGTLSWQEGSNEITTWVTQPLIKHQEDIFLLKKYRPIPVLNRGDAIKIYDRLGDAGILRTFVWGKQGGCWQDACELFGLEPLIMATFDTPDWVHEFLNILVEQKIAYIEKNLKKTPFDLVETGGGASSNTVISPSIHKKFCLPYDTIMHDCLRSMGFLPVYHTCGGMSKITKLIVQNHCAVSETLSPMGVGGDISTDEIAKQVYNDLHPYVGLIGGMDQINLLEQGTPLQIEREVERLFQLFGQDGGYIMSTSDHFFKAPRENLECFANAAQKYKYY